MDKDEALKLAIEKWTSIFVDEQYRNHQETMWWDKQYKMAYLELVNAGKEALAQPAQEPVAHQQPFAYVNVTDRTLEWAAPTNFLNIASAGVYPRLPLYTHPAPAKEWVGMSDDEIQEIRIKTFDAVATNYEAYRAIEQCLKEKNYG